MATSYDYSDTDIETIKDTLNKINKEQKEELSNNIFVT
jgi:hypothetical protein